MSSIAQSLLDENNNSHNDPFGILSSGKFTRRRRTILSVISEEQSEAECSQYQSSLEMNISFISNSDDELRSLGSEVSADYADYQEG